MPIYQHFDTLLSFTCQTLAHFTFTFSSPINFIHSLIVYLLRYFYSNSGFHFFSYSDTSCLINWTFSGLNFYHISLFSHPFTPSASLYYQHVIIVTFKVKANSHFLKPLVRKSEPEKERKWEIQLLLSPNRYTRNRSIMMLLLLLSPELKLHAQSITMQLKSTERIH